MSYRYDGFTSPVDGRHASYDRLVPWRLAWRGCLIRTIGRRLGLKANEAMELGKRTAALGLIELNFASVSLSYAGWKLVTEAAKKQAAGEPPSQPTPERLLTAPKSPSLPRNCH